MVTSTRQRDRPASLTVLIMHAERQVLDRRQLVGARARMLGESIRRHLTSPAILLLAGGVGFIAGSFTKRQASAPSSTGAASTSANTLLGRALKLFAVGRILWNAALLAHDGVHHSSAVDQTRSPLSPASTQTL